MGVIRLTATAGPDGVLRLEVPTGSAGGEFEVQVVVTPKPAAGRPKTPDELGWPPGYFENVIGSIDDPAFRRHPQGEYEKREPLD
jgi:hypothetical protein